MQLFQLLRTQISARSKFITTLSTTLDKGRIQWMVAALGTASICKGGATQESAGSPVAPTFTTTPCMVVERSPTQTMGLARMAGSCGHRGIQRRKAWYSATILPT